ncbi:MULTISPECIES: hypothetical protein [unclassified Nocardia]|uniref:hypothetical protein n=1 Tax=unclassified Nocardia TaxID=2637762 RepID=UPI0033AEEECD
MAGLIMGSPADFSIDPDEVRAHAAKMTNLMSKMTAALQAATYLGSADDGFGEIPRPFVEWIYDDDNETAIAAIRKLAESVSVLPGKLETVASTVEDVDGKFRASLDGLKAGIAESNGGR